VKSTGKEQKLTALKNILRLGK